jgi:hypothetical protein
LSTSSTRGSEERHGLEAALRRHDHGHAGDTAVEQAANRAVEQQLAAKILEQLLPAEPFGSTGGWDDRKRRHRCRVFYAGLMFTFKWKTLSGSYFFLIWRSFGRFGP